MKRLSLNICRVTKRHASVRDCHCIACDDHRIRTRARHREYRRARAPSYLRRIPRGLEALARWQLGNEDALRMYRHLVKLVKRDGLWDPPVVQSRT